MRKAERSATKKKNTWFHLADDRAAKRRVKAQNEMVRELTALLDVDRDTIIIRDMENRIVFWNRGAEEVFGWTRDEAVGRLYSDLSGVNYPCPVEEISRQLAATGRWEGEIRYAAEGKPLVILESRLCVQKDRKGKPIALLEIDNNITARKNAEESLRASEEHYRFLTDNISDLVGIVDLNMHFTFVSNNASQVMGYTVDEVMRRDVRGMLSPESLERIRNIIGHQIEIDREPGQDPKRTFLVEVEIPKKDGTIRLFEMKVSFLRDARGRITHLFSIGRDITDHKMIELSLKESEERYRSFLKNFYGIAYRARVSGHAVFFEGNVEAVAGYSGKDFVDGKVKWEQLIFPDDWENIRSSWDKARDVPGYATVREYRIIRQDQSITWVREHLYNQCDGSGKPAFIEGTIEDISAIKKSSEEQLWLASFPELNPNPIVETDIEGRIFYMSPSALWLFPDLARMGAKHPYLSGLRWVVDRIVNEQRQFFSREVDVEGLWYSQKIFTVENNSRLRIYGVDITESKLIAQRLRLVNQQLMDIIDFLPDATFVIDRHKRIIAWNRALEDMTGVQKEEMVGKGDYEYAIPFYGRRRPIVIDLIFKSDKEIESRYTYVKKKNDSLVAEVFVPRLNNGKGMFVWVKVAPLYDEKGVLVGAIESVRDITEHKEAEAILRQDREVFEELVKSKTDELLRMQKELVDAKHLSEIGSLAATIAHELRNPLAAIRTATYNVRRKTQDAKLFSHLDNIEKKVLESDQIINNLLSYSRIKTPQLERVKIHGILEECIKAASDRFPKYKVNVQMRCTCKKDDIIRADPLHMKELFNNILNNAYEALIDKKGVIAIKADYRARGNYTISFTDNGSGISSEAIGKVASPFFTTKSKGTGLGLTVCQQLVSLHNGTLDIKSQPGKGTTVTVSVPVGSIE